MRRTTSALSRLTLLGLILLVSGCATIYTDPEFDRLRLEHHYIAIIPFNVSINPEHQGGDVTEEELASLEKEQGETLQRAMYAQFLQGQQRGHYTVQFQDVDETNTLLTRELEFHPTRRVLSALTKSEICEILKVDAVISGDMYLNKPMGKGMAIASSLLLGVGAATNEAHISMSIHESESGRLLWNYEHVAKGGLLSSAQSVAKDVIKGVRRSFPYKKSN
ncbi:MAG: hypothetical protein OXG24_02630 [Gammaproteobacteria bacterium]|nr:hypothetical protein [Gammaproteobacteria bacterium]